VEDIISRKINVNAEKEIENATLEVLNFDAADGAENELELIENLSNNK
jgi:hypothetical protein